MGGNVNINNIDAELRNTVQSDGDLVARQTTTVTTSATDFLSSALDSQTTHVLWSVDGADIRVSYDGVNPTATVGHKVADASSSTWNREFAQQAKVIRDTGATANATITITELQKK